MSIYDQIEALLLRSDDGMTALELAEKLGIEKKAVNSILYEQSGNRYVTSQSVTPPIWKVRTAVEIESSELENHQDNLDGNTVISSYTTESDLLKACAACGTGSRQFFCSDRCRTQACQIMAKNLLEAVPVSDFNELLKLVVQDPTIQITPYVSDCGSPQCLTQSKDTQSFLDLWEANNRDFIKCISLLREHFDSDTSLNSTAASSSADLKLAIASVSSRYQNELIQALTEAGLSVNKRSVVECGILSGQTSLSSAARKSIEALIVRRQILASDLLRREIDQVTLEYVGASKELSDTLSVARSYSLSAFEHRGRLKVRNSEPHLKSEFDEMLLALVIHPVLPTYSIVENLLTWYPRVFVNAQRLYLSRLRYAMDQCSWVHRSPAFERTRRVTTLLEKFVNGGTLEVLGQETGVTRERVRQQLELIVAQCGVGTLRELRDVALEDTNKRKSRNREVEASVIEEISGWIRSHPGIMAEELRNVFPHEDKAVAIAVARHPALVLDNVGCDTRSEAHERMDILDSLRAASLLSFPLSANAYDQLVADGFVIGVSSMRIVQVYGSWREACRRADVEPGEALKNVDYVRKYAVKDMIYVVGRFLLDDDKEGRVGGMHSFGPWRERQEFSDSLPSAGTIRNQVDPSWKAVKRLALLELRKSWASECEN